jgi:beta-lactamase superfamily II metal-dependent hydrolase
VSGDIQIRTVTVELLRPGPAHNQLLSPLTQYLGICDDAEAGVVTQPFEHLLFLERMKAMRYVASGENDADAEGTRRTTLRELGQEAGRVLGRVPTLAGALSTDAAGPDTLVHLRLVLTPSELAALPFELAKTPAGDHNVAESWLSLHPRSPVVITRRTRNVSAQGVCWPMQPRVLFVSANVDGNDVPFDEHRAELFSALQPFCMPGRDDVKRSADGRREQCGQLLTILKDASFEELRAELAAQRYTHVHLLAHGAEDPKSLHASFGLLLKGSTSGEGMDDEFVSADRLAIALCGLDRPRAHRPSVVTLAACESAATGSVIVPGGSIAHVLHQAGVAMVVASQVPLSKEGSVLVVRGLYRGLLWGDNPWLLMHRLRTDLFGAMGATAHDWASLVVYESLPRDLDLQLEEARYLQAKAANSVALQRVDAAVQFSGTYAGEMDGLLVSLQRLPQTGRFAMEALGLRASSYKRLAQAEFALAQLPGCRAPDQYAVRSATLLEQSLRHYEQAVQGFLVNTSGAAVQRVASLHWVLVQQLSLLLVLNKAAPAGGEATARMSAQAYLSNPDLAEQAWAHGSLAELDLVALLSAPADDAGFQRLRASAVGHVRELLRLARRVDKPFIVESTAKQFQRYVDWWGKPLLRQVVQRLAQDQADQGVVIDQWASAGWMQLAGELVGLLRTDVPGTQSATRATPATQTISAAGAPAAPARALSDAAAPQTPVQVAAANKRTRLGGAAFSIDMLAAGHGDCLWLAYGSGKKQARLLVDCGTQSTFVNVLKARMLQQPANARHFELFILSHIDDDHIGGGVPLLKEAPALGVTFDDVWFNGWKHLKPFQSSRMLNARKGEVFSELAEIGKFNWNGWTDGRAIVLPESGEPLTHHLPSGLQLTLLSPTGAKLQALAPKWRKEIEALGKKPGERGFLTTAASRGSASTDVAALANSAFEPDGAANNGSSIAVLAEFQGKSVLLGADAHAPLLVQSVQKLLKARGHSRLKLSACKLPHHGSRSNLNTELLALLDCKNYLISSSGSLFHHPDREAVARVIRFGGKQPRLHFNYSSPHSTVWQDARLQVEFGYETVYPLAGQQGLRVDL